MAGNPIFHEDIAQISALKKAALDLLPVLEQMRNSIVEQAKATLENARAMGVNKESVLALTKSSDELKTQYSNVNKAISETKKAQDQLSQAEKAAAELEKQRSKEKAKYLSDLAKEEQKRRDLIKTAEMEAKSIDELAKKTAAMITMRKQMTDITGKNADAYNKLTKEIAENQKKLKAYDSQIGNHQRNVGNYGIVVDGIRKSWTSVMGVLAAAGGAIAAASGIIKFGQSVIESTGETTKRWKAEVAGVSFAFDILKKSIATGDFTGLINRMVEAIKIGREYSNTLSDITKMTRALSINNAELNVEFQKQKVIERDVSKSKEERIAAGKKALEIELEMTKNAQIVNKTAFDNEMKRITTITGLGKATVEIAVREYTINKEKIKQASQYNELLSQQNNLENQSKQNPDVVTRLAIVNEKILETPSQIKSLALVVKSMGKATGEELDKLTEKWRAMADTEAEGIQKTARVKLTLSRLDKGIIDDGIKDEKEGLKQGLNNQKEIEAKRKKYIEDRYNFQKSINKVTVDEEIEYQKQKLIEQGVWEKLSEEERNTWKLKITENYLNERDRLIKERNKEHPDISLLKNKTEEKNIPENAPMGLMVPGAKIESVMDEDPWEKYKKELEKIEEFAASARDILSSLSDWIKQDAQNQVDAVNVRYDSELAALDRQLASKTISEEKYNKEKVKIEKKRRDEETKIQKEAAEKQRTIQLIQSVINTALGVTGALGSAGTLGPVGAIIMAALIGVAGAIEIATIASQKFAKGGSGLLVDKSKGGVLQGKRHSHGGISLGEVGEAEDGEYFGIINRNSTEKYKNTLPLLFDAINSGKFENMFSRRGDINVKVSDKNTEAMLIEMKKQPRSETKAIDMGDYVIYQTGNYSLKVRKQ